MPTREDLLKTETHKERGLEVPRRVFYTLRPHVLAGRPVSLAEIATQAHRNSKCLALLIELLHKRCALTDEEIDELLLDVVR